MFIRRKTIISKRTGITSYYYQLVESVNTGKGPRLNVLLHIGQLDITEEERKILSTLIDHQIKGLPRQARFTDKIEQLAESIYFKYIQTFGKPLSQTSSEDAFGELRILKESLEIGYFRSVGAELLALHYWKALKFTRILLDCGFRKRQVELAQIAILGRLLSPGSECHTARWFNKQSSLSEFCVELRDGITKDSLYRIGDLILEHKSEIETKLRSNLKRLHYLVDRVYLYDLTNTYFEGNKFDSLLCKRGKSKEKRDDCPLVTLALVVDQDGFPVFSRIYAGNQSEPKTLKEVMDEIRNNHEDIIERLVHPMVVLDRGIATKDNIAWLKGDGYTYFVIERRNAVTDFRKEFISMEDFTESQDRKKGKLFLKKTTDNDLTRILVYSEAKALKERGMVSQRERRYLEEVEHLIGINKSGYLLDEKKILIRIGRIKERYGSVAGGYDFCLHRDKKNQHQITRIEQIDLNRKTVKAEFPGCYVIETNSVGLSSEEIWGFYMKLNEVEAAFRCLKTDLGTRPIHHQNDTRVEAHLFCSVLAYSILKSIIRKLADQDIHMSWTSIKEVLSTHMRATIMFTDPEGYRTHIRQTGQPEDEAKKLFSILKVKVNKNQITNKVKV
ncbi:MAG: IS1634 family transposase [Chloroflexi bacterium]|nr:IS1634 family transposase [Chloroflexota bacterium]